MVIVVAEFYFVYGLLSSKGLYMFIRGVWIDKDLASQRSLLRKLLKEATGKLLEEAS